MYENDMLLDNYPRNEYAVIPTPIQRAYYLAKAIGLQELLIKRDDNTGLAMGGNKAVSYTHLLHISSA